MPGIENSPILLTICIPTYRRAPLLARSLKKLYAKGVPLVKIIVGNNASPDNTDEVVQPYAGYENFSYYRNAENIGGDRNLVKMLGMVRTRFFMILTDDDYIDLRGLDLLLANLKKNPEVGAVLTPLESIRDDEDTVVHTRVRYRELKIQSPGLWSAHRHAQMGWTWTRLVFRTDAFDIKSAEAECKNCYFMVIMLGRICRSREILMMPERVAFHTIDNEVFWEHIGPNESARILNLETNMLKAFCSIFSDRTLSSAGLRLFWRVRIAAQFARRSQGGRRYIENGVAKIGESPNQFISRVFDFGRLSWVVPIVLFADKVWLRCKRPLKALRA